MDWIMRQNPIVLTLIATGFTWGVTALGAAVVFVFKTLNQKTLNAMLGFASGVMIAASFWSLLAPAIEMAEDGGGRLPSWAVVAIGFLLGAGFLWLADKLLPHMHIGSPNDEAEGLPSHLRRSVLIVLSITLHNIPEGMAVGVAIGAAAISGDTASMAGAMAVAIGIGLQNFPEGAAVSVPLRREGMSRAKSFFYGQLSGFFEPIAGVLGCLLVVTMQSVLPYALAFAAGAMIYVVTEELIPESQSGGHEATHLSTIGCILGFTIMMILDVALG